jgi:hypothetical protein
LTEVNTVEASDVAVGTPDNAGFRSRLLEALNESVTTIGYGNCRQLLKTDPRRGI